MLPFGKANGYETHVIPDSEFSMKSKMIKYKIKIFIYK